MIAEQGHEGALWTDSVSVQVRTFREIVLYAAEKEIVESTNFFAQKRAMMPVLEEHKNDKVLFLEISGLYSATIYQNTFRKCTSSESKCPHFVSMNP